MLTNRKLSLVARRCLAVTCTALLLYPLPTPATELNYGGHLKYFFTYSDFPDKSVFAGDDNPYSEHLGNLRLKLGGRGARWSGDMQYVMDALYSRDLTSCAIRGSLAAGGCEALGSDATQLFDLSTSKEIGNNVLLMQRLDRLWLGYTSDRLVGRFGRQAISWGNGMVYNTLDLFNPFAPDAIDTDYKRGTDMLYLQRLFDNGNDLQALLVPRRNIDSGDVESDESALAAKMHWLLGGNEMDLLVARNYGDNLLGFGYTTELAGNVVNTNISLTDSRNDTVFSAVVNYNFSSIVHGKNLTGFIEFFYNGFGLSGQENSVQDVVNDTALYERLLRGELFTTGRYYLAGSVQVEMTPLLILSPTLFVNLGDGSGLLQFLGTYSISENLDLLAGFNLPAGPDGSEYGGLETAAADDRLLNPPDTLFARLAWYF
jgi:hypothetical protein